ncbi:DUF1565 domain-containing protein [Desulfococcaceae bacterium HSG8]|nr:DUF1565 domain-containing protein [Desulfococcaceae bacterium HSG8]
MRRKVFRRIQKGFLQFAAAFLILAILPSVVCAQPPDIIKSVLPVSASQGETVTLIVTLDESLGTPPVPPSDVMPFSVKIGTIEGINVSRTDFVITATFNIPGTESVGAKDVSVEFSAPPDQPDMGSLVSAESGAFEVLPSGETGSLQVNIEPADAVTAGAQWKADSYSWQNSGTTVSSLTVGTHTVSFETIDGWTAPASQTVSVTAGEPATTTGTYAQNTCVAGDIDGNGLVRISDAIIVFQILTGLLDPEDDIQICSDVNNDGKIGSLEAVFILQNLTVTGLSGIIYVDADNASGVENGQSWATAHTTLTDALIKAVSGNEIWVAEGTYYPTTGTDRNASFSLIAGVTLYGGFAGTESGSDERDWEVNKTVLSGDIGTSNDNSDNAYHVVVGSNDAIIDGFTIQDGNADLANDGSGSLVETSASDMEILRIVTDIRSAAGGGMLNVHAATVTRNCTFRNNSASKGGAVYNMVTKTWNPGSAPEINASPYFENCVFDSNSASGRGGAVNSDFFTSPTYLNCQFLNNHCDSKGGAVYNDMGCPSYFVNVLFAGNTAERGAAVVADGSASHRMAYCTFVGNTADDLGAALYQGTYMGDDMQSGQTFRGNEVHLYNSLLVGNSSESSSNSVSNWHDDSATYDTDSVIETEDGTYTVTDYLDAATYASKNADYGWQPDRVTGAAAWIATFDDDANSAFVTYSYDTSASAGSAGTVYVNDDAADGGDGSSWGSAYNDLQDALAAAPSGSQIWVAAGTYKPTDGTDREAAFVMKAGVEIYGGFDGAADNALNDRDPTANVTILSGDIGVANDTADNSYHVLFGASDATVDGFTIRDGRAEGKFFNSRGGGLLCYDGNSPTVSNCTFTDNYATEGGAIAAYYNSAPTVTDCTIDSNSAERAGGILFRTGPDSQATGAQVSGTIFSNNSASDRGGAVYVDYGAWPSFTNCTFTSNTATGNGGSVYVDNNSSQLSVIQTWFDTCTFEDNVTGKRGGAFAIYEGTVHLSASTVTNNSAGTGGGGIALDYQGAYNADELSTIFGNQTTSGDADIDDDSSGPQGPPEGKRP